MKVLILVLSSRNAFYPSLMKAQAETWDKLEVPDIETLFYLAGKGMTREELKIDPQKIFYSSLQDNYSTLGLRTIEVFKWALQKGFDFILRVNASTYVDKKSLAEYVKTLPTEKLYMGLLAPYTHN